MKNFTNGQVGKGTAQHAVFTVGPNKGKTACGKTSNGLVCEEAAFTCKSCLNVLPSWHGVEIAEETPATVAPAPRIIDTRTGVVRRILGTSPATNAPHKTMVWVQREGEQGAQAWSVDQLMSSWHDLVAIDEVGNTRLEAAHAEALEFAEIMAFERDMYGQLIAEGASAAGAVKMVASCRDLDTPWSSPTAATARYDQLLHRHGTAVPSGVRATG